MSRHPTRYSADDYDDGYDDFEEDYDEEEYYEDDYYAKPAANNNSNNNNNNKKPQQPAAQASKTPADDKKLVSDVLTKMKQVANLNELNLSVKQIEECIRKSNYNSERALDLVFDLAEDNKQPKSPVVSAGKKSQQPAAAASATKKDDVALSKRNTVITAKHHSDLSASNNNNNNQKNQQQQQQQQPVAQQQQQQQAKQEFKPIVKGNDKDQQQQQQQQQQQDNKKPKKNNNNTTPLVISNNSNSNINNNNINSDSGVASPSTPITPSTVFAAANAQPSAFNLVIVGHVDAGKSTLMGHLLVKTGQVSDKQMHKFKKESAEIGKGSFAYAWVLDEHEEERSRGVTIDVGIRFFETSNTHKRITILDSPGHKDFIPNMITGAAQADAALLVIDALPGAFEAGMKGQTREHLILVRSCGVKHLIVAINKMDAINWSKQRFDEITTTMTTVLKQIGFNVNPAQEDVIMVPLSGFTGENLTKPITDAKHPLLVNWKQADAQAPRSLMEAIETMYEKFHKELQESLFNNNNSNNSSNNSSNNNIISVTSKNSSSSNTGNNNLQHVRMTISDVYKNIQTGLTIAGKLESGIIKSNDKLLVLPLNEQVQVKSLMKHKEATKVVCIGDNVELCNVQGVNINDIDKKLVIGQVLCSVQHPIPITNRFIARIITFDTLDIPILKGAQVSLHIQHSQVSATITKLNALLNKSLEVAKKKPKLITKNSSALVEITCDSLVCVETFENCRPFGRFMLREQGKTIATGIITEIKKVKKTKSGSSKQAKQAEEDDD